MRRVFCIRSQVVAFRKLPVECIESRLFHGVSDHRSVLEENEGVCRSESEGSLTAHFGDGHELLGIGRAEVRTVARKKGSRKEKDSKAHLTPATPSTTRSSPVIVPVLSKQHTSTRPANGIRNGSVQKMAKDQPCFQCRSKMTGRAYRISAKRLEKR